MKKTLLFSAILFFATISILNAQQKNALISFKKTAYDFGTIKEDDGKVTFSFEFVNSGEVPLILQKVITSCDCTSSEWQKEPVAPNAIGHVKVIFDPKNRPGAFDKTITVYSNGRTQSVVLQIKGNVIGRARSVEEVYARPISKFRFKSNLITLDRVMLDDIKIDTVEFISIAKEPVKIGSDLSKLSHLKVRFVPETVKPNEKGLMIITYDPKKRNDWGFVVDRFYITEDDKIAKGGLFSITASIEENFSKLTEEQKELAPKIKFEKNGFDYGQVEEGALVEHEFTFTNNGKSDLVIRKIKPGCGCTTVEPIDKVIKPGQNGSFKATFNTKGYTGRNSKVITVISNDPVNPVVNIRLTGQVNSPK